MSDYGWRSLTDPDCRNDGRTGLACHAEHAVDLDTEVIVAAGGHPDDERIYESGPKTLQTVHAYVVASGSETPVSELVKDGGHHGEIVLPVRSARLQPYIFEPRHKSHRLVEKRAEFEAAF